MNSFQSNNAKQLSQSQTTLLLIVLAVISCIIGLVISKAILGTILFNNKVISQKRAVDSVLAGNLDRVDEIHQSFDQLADKGIDYNKVLRALPANEDTPALATKLEAMMGYSGVAFESFSLIHSGDVPTDQAAAGNESEQQAAGTATDGIIPITFTVTVKGPYQNVVKLLGSFQNELAPMKILNLDISGTEQQASAVISVETYYQPEVSLQYRKEPLQ